MYQRDADSISHRQHHAHSFSLSLSFRTTLFDTLQFGRVLDRYFKAMGRCPESAIDPCRLLNRFDLGRAAARIIASVPGYHRADLNIWGHMGLRQQLRLEAFDDAQRKNFARPSVSAQFSSIGSVSKAWMNGELKESLLSGIAVDAGYDAKFELIYPTVEQIRTSNSGYVAGGSVPGREKNVDREHLRPLYCKLVRGSQRVWAGPHMKTYTRHNDRGECAWVCVTSANFSTAAWGVLQKNKSQLMIRSWEVGVLLLPSLLRRFGADLYGFRISSQAGSAETQITSRSFALPALPYDLPPPAYEIRDEPWCVDRRYTVPDSTGRRWLPVAGGVRL